MIPIPTAAVVNLARTIATSVVAQAAAGTVIGLGLFYGSHRVIPAIGRAWHHFRKPSPTFAGEA